MPDDNASPGARPRDGAQRRFATAVSKGPRYSSSQARDSRISSVRGDPVIALVDLQDLVRLGRAEQPVERTRRRIERHREVALVGSLVDRAEEGPTGAEEVHGEDLVRNRLGDREVADIVSSIGSEELLGWRSTFEVESAPEAVRLGAIEPAGPALRCYTCTFGRSWLRHACSALAPMQFQHHSRTLPAMS